jgi:hypothetical protein
MDGQGDFRALYTFGCDSPEGYAIEKDGKIFYAFTVPANLLPFP